jgi:hypothetical protein
MFAFVAWRRRPRSALTTKVDHVGRETCLVWLRWRDGRVSSGRRIDKEKRKRHLVQLEALGMQQLTLTPAAA